MQSDRETFPFSPLSPNHRPTYTQSTDLNPPTPTTYSLCLESQQLPYYSQRYCTDTTSQQKADGQPQGMDYHYPTKKSQSSPAGYPESSQRTMLDDGPFPDDYNPSVRSNELGVTTRGKRLGRSGEHRLISQQRSNSSMTEQITPSPSTELYDVMSLPPDKQSSPNRRRTYNTSLGNQEPGENNFFYRRETSTDIGSLQFEDDGSPTLPSLPSLAHENPPDSNPMILTFQMHTNYQEALDDPQAQSFMLPPGGLNEDSGILYASKGDPDYLLNTTMQPQSPIPMCNSSGWEQPSLSSALDARADLATTEQSNSPARTTPESESSASIHHSGFYTNSPDTQCSSSATTSSSGNTSKRKKSKMHQCELCPKKFPRPSGLRTHMNTHNNVKPFPCGFPSCPRTFAVRSNAKRHLRTHGVLPSSVIDPAPAPYVVGFSVPLVLPQSPQHHQMSKAPFKFRWIPHSLSTRTNAATLRSESDHDSESNDGDYDDNDDACMSPVLSMPLPPVSPSSPTAESDDQYEERDSNLEAGSHPYHPSQFRGLPGPVVGIPRTLVAL